MRLSDTKIITDDDRIQPLTPEMVAGMFAGMGADEQAAFFNCVGEISSKWSWGGMSMQLQYITDEDGLTLAGRRVMQEIGEYSHWGLVPRGKL